MEENEWEDDDVKEFARLVEQSKRTWKPAKKELQTINVSTRQDKRELKMGTLITTSERENLISLPHEYANVFTWSYTDISSLDINIVVQKVPLNYRRIHVKQKL